MLYRAPLSRRGRRIDPDGPGDGLVEVAIEQAFGDLDADHREHHVGEDGDVDDPKGGEAIQPAATGRAEHPVG